MERFVTALRSAVPESPEFDSALVALAGEARLLGLRGSEVVSVLVSALRGAPIPEPVGRAVAALAAV